MKTAKHIPALLILALTVLWLSRHRGASDWRYPKLLITQAPKMPFRYFV